MNCVIYARVSTDKQADKELSIPAQIQAMRDYAHQRDWRVLEEFLEPGASAKTADRPALQQLLGRIRRDPPVNVILVHKIDRLARNVYDHATIKALLHQRGIRLASVVENIDDTVSGQLVENIMASIAQFYSGNLGEEVKKGMRQKVRMGGWPHMPPLGYRLVRHAGVKSTIEIDSTVGPLVRLAFELYATGRWGVRALAEHLYKEGLKSRYGKKLAQSNIRKILENPFFAGRLRWEGKEFPGNQDALVSQELFAQVQRMIDRRREDPKPRLAPTAFPLKIVAVCASCRGSMTAEMHGRWSYYRCCRRMANKEACSSRLCNATIAHADLERLCRRLTISTPLAVKIESATVGLLRERSEASQRSLPALKRRHAEMAKRHQALTESFIDGQITPETFQGLAGSLRSDIAVIEKQIELRDHASDLVLTRVRRILRDAGDVWTLHGTLAPARQIELLRLVFTSLVLAPSGIVGHVVREPFASLFEPANKVRATNGPTNDQPDARIIAEACIAAADGELATDISPAFPSSAPEVPLGSTDMLHVGAASGEVGN